MDGTLDLWSLDITFTSQINWEHALELSFKNLRQLLRTFTLCPAVCLLQNMGGNAKSIVLKYSCQEQPHLLQIPEMTNRISIPQRLSLLFVFCFCLFVLDFMLFEICVLMQKKAIPLKKISKKKFQRNGMTHRFPEEHASVHVTFITQS